MKKVLVAIGAALMMVAGMTAAFASTALADNDHKVTICHVAGLAEDPANTVTITADRHAIFKDQGGHFYENGTAQAGHEQDYLGACQGDTTTTGTTTTVVTTDPDPDPVLLAAGVSFNEATCQSGPSFSLVKSTTSVGQRPFYNVEGPLVDGKPVAGASYTITAIAVAGYVFSGQTVWTHTFAAAPTNCGGSTTTTTTTTTSPPGPRCPDPNNPGGQGKDGQPGNDDCAVPPVPTTPTTPVDPGTPPVVVPPATPPVILPEGPTSGPKPDPAPVSKPKSSKPQGAGRLPVPPVAAQTAPRGFPYTP